MKRRTSIAQAAAAALSLLILPACGPPAVGSGGPTSPEVDAIFADLQGDRPGAVVGVVWNGEVVHRAGYGAAHLDHGVPITPETVFDIASISKQFGALAALLLESEGKLDLDADVRGTVPELPDFQRGDHGAPPDPPHQRDSRLAAHDGARRDRLHRRHLVREDPADAPPPAGDQLPARLGVRLFEHRLQPAGALDRGAVGDDLPRVHRVADLRAPRDDPHPLLGRLPRGRARPGGVLRPGRRRRGLPADAQPAHRAGVLVAAHHHGRLHPLDAQLRDRAGRRRGDAPHDGAAGRADERRHPGLRPWPVGDRIPGAAGLRSRGFVGGVPHQLRALPGAGPLDCGLLQRRGLRSRRAGPPGGRGLHRRPHGAGAGGNRARARPRSPRPDRRAVTGVRGQLPQPRAGQHLRSRGRCRGPSRGQPLAQRPERARPDRRRHLQGATSGSCPRCASFATARAGSAASP